MSTESTPRWAIHVTGPDDMLAAPSREEALNEAMRPNKAFATLAERKGENWPRCKAVVVESPFDEKEHAEDVKQFGQYL